MAEAILFNPENRSLATSTGDLGLYGGQTDPSVDVHALRVDDVGNAPPGISPSGGNDSAGPSNGGAAGTTMPAADLPFGDTSGATSLTPVAFVLTPVTSFQPAASPLPFDTVASGNFSTFAAAVPGAIGSGTIVPQPAADPVTEAPSVPGVEALPVAAVVDGAVATLAGAATVTTPLVAEVTQVAETATTLLTTTLDGLGAATVPLLEGVAQVADTAGTLVTTTVESVGDLATTVVDGLGETVSATVTVLPAIAETVGDTLTATVGAVGDTLDGLAGSNPEGGIATLVSLVSAADMFDLQPTNAPSIEATGGDLGFDLLDTLADADAGFGSLLGGDHHDDAAGLFGSHGDSAHPLGL